MVRTAVPFHQVIKTDTAHLPCLLYAHVTITQSNSFIVSPGAAAVSQWKPASAGTCRRSCGSQYSDRRNAMHAAIPFLSTITPTRSSSSHLRGFRYFVQSQFENNA